MLCSFRQSDWHPALACSLVIYATSSMLVFATSAVLARVMPQLFRYTHPLQQTINARPLGVCNVSARHPQSFPRAFCLRH